jgi:hypothetical protein
MKRINCTTVNNEEDFFKSDMCSILNYNGNIKGYSNIVNYANFENNIFSNILNDDIKNSKGIIMVFNYHPNVSFQDLLIRYLSKINDLVSNDCNVIFSNSINNDLDEDTIDYKILLTGL